MTRTERWNDGYRVWVGARYPFYVPPQAFRGDRFAVGLTIRIGGYFNSRGYYDYYDEDESYDRYDRDDRYDRSDGGYRDELRFREATLRGVVESVDERRGRFVLRNDATGNEVTISLRGEERRSDVRPGDYIEVDGEWTRLGLFEAYDLDFLDRR